MSWLDSKQQYIIAARRIESTVQVVSKDHWLWSALWWVGVIFTLGALALGISKSVFLERFATTIGPVQGYPSSWSLLKMRTIAHESRHTKQVVFFGWFVPVLGWITRSIRAWVGLIPGFCVYFLLPFPVYLAFGRYYLELDADKVSFMTMLEGGESAAVVLERAESRAITLSGGSYLWCWPRSWAKKMHRKAAVQVILAYKLRI